ncbi:MAG: hypothetical protein HYZ32_02080, partial [Hydrocarboniphaga effusa]|nr:hypothetical protein [Hydrocarboniphaga effusa]
VCWQDQPLVKVREEFAALPPADYWKEAGVLLDQERYSEALLVVDAGIEALPGHRASLLMLRDRIELEQGRWMNLFQQLGQGALTGTGKNLEALTGAVVADLFVFGDVRDLVVQAGRKLSGEETDEVIVALSAGGILLTVSPALDLGAALLKFARRMGAMTERFAKNLLKVVERAVKQQNADEVLAISGDMAALSKQARPAGALAILKNVDDPAELQLAARFAEKPGGTFALWLGGRQTMTWLKQGGKRSDDLLLQASRRGRYGFDYLARNSDLLLKPHPLLGLVKGLYKGNIPDLLIELMQRYAQIVLGLAAGWLLYEFLLLLVRLLNL